MKPVIALVGRPNVGKSTLFNRLTKSRDAIVADFAGLTRDRHYGNGKLGKHEYIVIDTGGFEPDASSGIYREMAKQTQQAVAEADVVIFVVDARAGLSAQDHDIANYLRRLGKPCLLVGNKAEGMREGVQLAEFYELGLGEVLPVSAAHGQGVRSMLESALDTLQLPEPEDEPEDGEDKPIRLAVAGRPNVGKSTLINTWLGEGAPGRLRHARHHARRHLRALRAQRATVRAHRHRGLAAQGQGVRGHREILGGQDPAGHRVRQCRAAAAGRHPGVTDQDAHIAGYILESGRAVVLAVNKWDAVDDYGRQMLERSIETRLSFLKFASLHFISAKKRQGLGPLWTSIAQAHKAATCKMPTPVLTRLLLEAVQFQAPKRSGMFRPKMRYAHQGGMNPPVIVIHGNSLEHVTDAYKRFLEGRFRKEFDLVGTPLRIEMKTSRNPFAEDSDA